ncbi:uncharacterized protein TRAVEDRAFT_71873 [Trametes versicolor FP-101664 SS1]|uniref:uncharacterized protein n=1 Tax=Trametes versicolor (strain FP-101664) TaxID=717944 RepID=UPI00046222DA|nr:uncharacterized protein TRAVEDRAFT_71873 [Trametes versicolor FP-101664 SS1]EIW58180.1 hypothetical protein TRAVEDRAFT_71873 [Trametes versicolor FP-101664 SS1]
MALGSKTLNFESSNLGGDVACTLLLCLTGGDPVEPTVHERPVIWKTSLSSTEISKATYVWNGRMAFHTHQIDISPSECPGERTALVTEPIQCGSPPLYVFRDPTPFEKSSSVAAVNETDRTMSVSFGYAMNSGVIHDVRTWKNLGVGMRAEPDKKYLDPILSIYMGHADTVVGEHIQTDKPIWKKALSDIGPATKISITRNAKQGFVADSEEIPVGCPCHCDADQRTRGSGCCPPTSKSVEKKEVKPPTPDQDGPCCSGCHPGKGKEPEHRATEPTCTPTTRPPPIAPPAPPVEPTRTPNEPRRAAAGRIDLAAQLTVSVSVTGHPSTSAEGNPSPESPTPPGSPEDQPPSSAEQTPGPAAPDPVTEPTPCSKPPPEAPPKAPAEKLDPPARAGPAELKATASIRWGVPESTTHAEQTPSPAIRPTKLVASAEQTKTITSTIAPTQHTSSLEASSGPSEQTRAFAAPVQLTVMPCALAQQMTTFAGQTGLPFITQLLTAPVPAGWPAALLAALATGQIFWSLPSANAQVFYTTAGNDINFEIKLSVRVAGRRG